jgi:AcrR family transcriptional regulator
VIGSNHTVTRRTRLPASERRALVIEAAIAEFAQRGYEAASIGRIAAAAGVSRTVLYDHFDSKQELFAELLRAQNAELIAHVGEPIASGAPLRERIHAAYDVFFRFVEEQPLAWRLLFPAQPPLDPEVAAEYRHVRGEANRVLAELLAPDARRTGVDPVSPVGRALFAIHLEALYGAARWWHAHPDVPRGEMVRAAMAALWTGMGAAERGEPWVSDT